MATTLARQIPTSSLTVAPVNFAATADIVALVSAKKILVWELILFNSTTSSTLTFKSGTTALTGAMTFSSMFLSRLQNAKQGYETGVPLFETAAGEAFVGTLSAGSQISGQIIYSTETP